MSEAEFFLTVFAFIGVTVLREMRREVAELGERVDFTERLLAKQGQAGRLPGS